MRTEDRRNAARAGGVPCLALLLVLFATPARAQAESPACDLGCSPSDLLCVARQHLCRSKLDVYRGYMARLGAGVEMHALPPRYVELLQPLFPAVDLDLYRFGFGDHQPPRNAITDCDRTYFGEAEFVDRLRAGDVATDAEFEWLFHELAHVQQCAEVGGRDHYAKVWFAELGIAALGSLNPLTLHERMRMEGAALDAARRALDAIRPLRDADGRLAPALGPAAQGGSAVDATAPRPLPLHQHRIRDFDMNAGATTARGSTTGASPRGVGTGAR